ncbi:MAG: hypothetical protein Greene041619_245 [Candidatus Peregrinibacteria bacterium Greene0416_19]|nr:MAG: hypothetical protein Greene041619_245 [Candidatus Peregrinibacteria bacterium Greene0416_19]
MTDHPFAIFSPFRNALHVQLLTKEDRVHTDGEIARALAVPTVASLRQVHGNRVVRVSEPTSRTVEADGMIMDARGLTLAIRAADCQNFVIYAPKKNVGGVLHAGWRCLNAGTIAAFYELLQKEWGIQPQDTYVGAGPSLGKECAEFSDPRRELPSAPPDLIDGRYADLIETSERQFDVLGVPRTQRERINACTTCHPETYWTYRGGDREKVLDGWTNVLACRLL